MTPQATNRREFLQSAGAAIAAGALSSAAPSAAAAAPAAEKKYKKALKWSMIKYEGSVLDKFRMLKECGYDGVEIEAPNKLDPAEVVAAREATGLEVPGVVDSVHWKQHLSDPDAAV